MKPNISFGEMAAVIDARLRLLVCQSWLWNARVRGSDRETLARMEVHVLNALDRVWEAQQRAA